MCACLSKLRVRYQNPLRRVYIFHMQWKSSFLYFCIYVSTYLNKGSFRRMQYCKDGWKFEFKKFNFNKLYQKMQMIQILWDENESLDEILKRNSMQPVHKSIVVMLLVNSFLFIYLSYRGYHQIKLIIPWILVG